MDRAVSTLERHRNPSRPSRVHAEQLAPGMIVSPLNPNSGNNIALKYEFQQNEMLEVGENNPFLSFIRPDGTKTPLLVVKRNRSFVVHNVSDRMWGVFLREEEVRKERRELESVVTLQICDELGVDAEDKLLRVEILTTDNKKGDNKNGGDVILIHYRSRVILQIDIVDAQKFSNNVELFHCFLMLIKESYNEINIYLEKERKKNDHKSTLS